MLNTAIEVLAAEVRRLREERDLFVDAGKAAEDRIVELREELRAQNAVIGQLETKLARVGTLVSELPSTRGYSIIGEILIPVAALERIRDAFLDVDDVESATPTE